MLRLNAMRGIFVFVAFCSFSVNGILAQDTTAPLSIEKESGEASPLRSAATQFIRANTGSSERALFPPSTKVVGVDVTTTATVIDLSPEAVRRPWRESEVTDAVARVTSALSTDTTQSVALTVAGRPLMDYVPPAYRAGAPARAGKSPVTSQATVPLARNVSAASPVPSAGLDRRNIVVWASHGVYFANKGTQRWEWQRPRLFTTVEDMLTMSIMNPYLIPMLESAGATVFSCRERDPQLNEVVVDDGDSRSRREFNGFSTSGRGFRTTSTAGFKNGLAPFPDGLNPHREGTTRYARTTTGRATAVARWQAKIPADGDYAVYVSYATTPESATDAHYTIRHGGGATEFRVNQRMAGNTWVYLGTFSFTTRGDAVVELDNQSAVANATVSADAVKIGGGMGNVQRGEGVSGYPRYAEAARYWFQYAGIDPALAYAFGGNAGDEYTEDYISRSEYANILNGAPGGPGSQPNFAGLGVPVDLSFALHSDAGVSTGVVGTLAIFTSRGENKRDVFPNGRDRMMNRDLADLIQTQIVDDVRAKYSSDWTRRDLRDASYAEARRPNTPSVLVELLSHQNYDDIKFALDPRFRFDVARAIYKGMLRFLAAENGFTPVVMPLAPDHLQVRATAPGRIRVQWKPVVDPLEATAAPDGYVVYARTSTGGFDNGTLVKGAENTALEMKVSDPEAVVSFRVTAWNAGGESLPGEILSVRTGEAGAPRALIVNAFDRVAPPTLITGDREGADRSEDNGVGDGWNVGLVGSQYDFDRSHAWAGNDTPYTNDNPGHGASYAQLERGQEAGNTRDFALLHGESFAKLGWAFDSVSDEAVSAGLVALKDYPVVDWLLGEERTTPPPPAHYATKGAADRMKPEFVCWPPEHQQAVRAYIEQGGALLANGSYVATDLIEPATASAADASFLKDVLCTRYMSGHGPRFALVESSETTSPFTRLEPFIANGAGTDGAYHAENPGVIEGLAKADPAVLRYREGSMGAAVASDVGGGRRIVLAFPLDCVSDTTGERTALLKECLDYLAPKKP